jgi:hypothetical protein
MGLPVYAGAFGPLVGFLIGPATVAGQAGAVPAIDISVFVDGAVRSVWRRESEVRTWYAPMDIISARECQWKRPGINWGRWEPTPLELGLDVRLWHRRFRRGWSTHHGLFAGGPPI